MRLPKILVLIIHETQVNSLTQTVFYRAEFMRRQQYRGEEDFAKQMINQFAEGGFGPPRPKQSRLAPRGAHS